MIEKYFEYFVYFLVNLRRSHKKITIIFIDAALMYLALWSALYLRLSEFYIPPTTLLTAVFLSAPVIGVTVFHQMKVYRQITRYLDTSFLARISFATSFGVLIWAMVILLCGATAVPRSVIIMYGILTILFIWMSREAARWLLKDAPRPADQRNKATQTKNVLIYGAGRAGIQLLQDLQANTNYQTVGFIDDDKRVLGQRINGLKVYSRERIQQFLDNDNVSEIFVAIPEAPWAQRREVISLLDNYKVLVKSLPAIGDIASGRVEVSALKPVDVLDLLGRPPVPPNTQLLDQNIKDKIVMVTGAGGSIGSEISRQILQLKPKMLLLFEVSEVALYEIHEELLELQKEIGRDAINGPATQQPSSIIPILGSVLDARLIDSIMLKYGIQTIYHAAAYKHVPLVEQNPFSGLRNNTFGTMTLAGTALKAGVERFVLVSTDKAVRPTNIMGASKRLAELILQSYAEKSKTTVFTMVRFGNVLDSSGSVLRCFKKQILKGGPVTVTHPNIIRYFMSIPEAAGLVIQAGAMAEGGDVFVLDMGEPIKIDDMARSLIGLLGLELKSNDNPDGDIAIEYVGLRPGEKLYEELLIGENTTGTDHPRIMKNKEPHIPGAELDRLLRKLAKAIEEKDLETVIHLLQQMVEGYRTGEMQPLEGQKAEWEGWAPRPQTIH